jgi:enoyl-CoA hydratase/carnithine racemase
VLLSARDFSATEAERYGFINRALPSDELDRYVDDLAHRIAGRSAAVVGMHQEVFKRVYSPMVEPMFAGLAAENDGFRSALSSAEFSAGIEAMLSVQQSREHELDLPATISRRVLAQS